MQKKQLEITAAYLIMYAFVRITILYTPELSSLGQGLIVQWLMIYVLVIYYVYNRADSAAPWAIFDLEKVSVQRANILVVVTIFMWAAINIAVPWRIGTSYDQVELIVLGLLGAPIIEEVFFRQMMLKELLPAGKAFALIVSTVAFAAIHMGLYSILIALIMGFVLGYAFMVTRNILVPIAMHFVYNLLTILLNT